MVLSRHNITGRLKDSEGSFIINPLSRSADLLSPERAGELASGTFSNPRELAEKGYLVDPDEETRNFRAAYLDFLDSRDHGETQLFFVPWYSCNFACPYCYQEGYAAQSGVLGDEVSEAFFNYVGKEFAGRSVYVTLFGGEPLLPGRPGAEKHPKVSRPGSGAKPFGCRGNQRVHASRLPGDIAACGHS